MTSSVSLLFSVLIYSLFQYLKYNTAEEESDFDGKKSNICSKIIYLFGVLLFIYRFERQPWRQTVLPLRLLFDALSAVVAFELLYTFLWQRVEFFFLEVVPVVVNDRLKSVELFSQTPEWPYVLPLLFISLLFLCFAHNSDIYIDYFLQLDELSDGYYSNERDTDPPLRFLMNPVVPMSGGYGEPGRRQGMCRLMQVPSYTNNRHTPVTRVRGNHTLTDTPLRRSQRLQNRST